MRPGKRDIGKAGGKGHSLAEFVDAATLEIDALQRGAEKALQWLRGPDRWVLKSPQHLEQLGPLFSTFPDATIAFTHRDPVAVIQSAVTMNALSSLTAAVCARTAAARVTVWTRIASRIPSWARGSLSLSRPNAALLI